MKPIRCRVCSAVTATRTPDNFRCLSCAARRAHQPEESQVSIEIRVIGHPKAQPRARACAFRGRARVYTPKTPTVEWKAAIVAAAQKAMKDQTLSGPVAVDCAFRMPRPQKHLRANGNIRPDAPRWHTSKPDRDNLDKAVLDALSEAGIWGDDCQACDGRISKVYDEPAGVTITLRPLGDDHGN